MNNFINLAHLKFFCDTIVYQSISEAAKKNFISQSAISQAINKLENVFGVPLLVHNKQKLMVTEQGQIVFDQASEIFKSINQTFTKIDQTKDVITGVLKFATTKSLGMSFFAPTYVKIKKNLPDLKLKIKMGGRTDIRTALRREDVEFAIVVYDHTFNQFSKHTVKQGNFNLYQLKNAPENLLDQGVFIDEYNGMYIENINDLLMEKYQHVDFQPLSGWELAANCTNLGIGVGFFPDYVASKTRFPNIELHPLKLPVYEYEIAVIYNKSTQLSKAAHAFIEQFILE